MKLSTKLFIIVGSLFALICLAVYVLPEYIVQRHVDEDRAEFLDHLQERRIQEQGQYFQWLGESLNMLKASIDANLVLVGDHTAIQRNLELDSPRMSPAIWQGVSDLLWRTEAIDFFQIMRNGVQTVGGDLGTAKNLDALHVPINDTLSWVVVQKNGGKQAYLGVWLPSTEVMHEKVVQSPDHKAVPTLYLLFDPEALLQAKLKEPPEESRSIAFLVRQLEEAQKRLQEIGNLPAFLHELEEKAVPAPPPRSSLGSFYRNLRWGPTGATPEQRAFRSRFLDVMRLDDDLEMISALAFACSDGVICESPLEPMGPQGVLHLVPAEGAGVAILAENVFFDRPIYDVERFIQQNPSLLQDLLSGETFALVEDFNPLTLVNTMVWRGGGDNLSYITMGISIEDLVQTLSHISGEASFLVHNGKILRHALPSNVQLSDQQFAELARGTSQLDENGQLNLDGTEFFYSKYLPDPRWKLSFVTLERVDRALRSYEIYKERSAELMRRFTLQLLSISLALFLLSLLALELISRQFTKPIRSLADAAHTIGEGHYRDVVLPTVSPTSKDEVSVLTRAFGTMVTGLDERERMRSALDKVVSKEVAEEILKGNVALGGEVRDVAVLFADIRGFTHLTENLPPEEVIGLVNTYMTRMASIIEAHHGVIDKYIGDEVMALYGAPVAHKFSTLQAVLSAILMRSELESWNRERREAGLFEVQAGTSVHVGPMVAGNMGAENRLNYTVLGANVNLASRLCDKAGPMEILISEAVAGQTSVSEVVEIEKGEALEMKGFTEKVQTYRVVGMKRGKALGELSSRLQEFVKE